ncbi:MAG: hypothetical protein PF488_04160, partial [Patescibacteria group bacterium]|nr:hypothetical protein [Patescibacteria group bacterium]
MFDYLQKFNNLPKELRDKVSSKEVMDKVLKLENKYGVELAALIMKVMIKTVPIKSLPRYISSEFSLGAEDAKELSNHLFVHIFSKVVDYLGIKDEFKKNKEYFEISELIKKSGIKLASDDLLNRLKNIILTYKKGVRDKINTKNSLAKPVEIGGLGLTDEEVDKVFSVISKENKYLNKGQNIDKNTNRDKLDSIIKEAEGLSGAYDLKKAIEEKNDRENEVKKISEGEKIKNLPLEEKEKSLPLKEKSKFFSKPEKTLNLPLEKEEDEEKEGK